MRIISDFITTEELRSIAEARFGNLIKVVIDVDMGLISIDADMHSDLEAMLLQNGSRQESLWGINIYPEQPGEDMIEFDSMINVRPSQGNRSRSVEDERLRKKIIEIVMKRIR